MFFRFCLCYFCTIYTIAKVTQRTFDIVKKNRDHANIIASEASSVTNCANLRFLVYIFICRRTSFLVPRGPPVTRNAQTSDRPVEV